MAVKLGAQSIRAYVMGVVKNNKLMDLSKTVHTNQTKVVSNQFRFQPPVYIPDDTKYFVVDCDRPYKLKYIS